MATEMVDDSSVNSLQAKIHKYFIDAESASIEAPVAKIKRVPRHLRERMPGADNYFEPTVLYLGPFHRGKDIPVESKLLKKKAATIFMRTIGEKCFDTCKKIYDEIDSLMKCYELVAGEEEGSSERSTEEQEQQIRRWKEENSWMLLEDGCAILYFICRKDINTSIKDVTVPINAVGIAMEDILKLENQIPYQVLTLLMESAFEDSVTWRSMIDKFITIQILRITPRAQNLGDVSSLAEPVHLLQHLRKRLVGILPSRVSAPSSVGPQTITVRPAEDVELEAQQSSSSRFHHHVLQTTSSLAAPVHLLQHLRERLVGILPSRVSALSRTPSFFTAYWGEFSSSYNSAATSLESRYIQFKGVHFKNNLTNISCDLGYRRVNIPSIAISTSSKSILMNLAADEVSSDIPNSFEISSFLHFLDKLVYSPEDAKVLRKAKVIHNSISNDEEAAAFINDTAALLPTNGDLFGDVEKKIQYLLEIRRVTLIGSLVKLYKEYFSSPWAVIAFVGGMLVLSLTILQTYVTIFPVPEELVKNANQREVNELKVTNYLMKRMVTAILLPLPLLLTLLSILIISTVTALLVFSSLSA